MNVKFAIVYVMLITPFLGPLFARQRDFPQTYFSWVFVLTLSPLLCAAIAAFLDINDIIDYEDNSWRYVLERLQFAHKVLSFGIAASTLSVAAYSLVRGAASRARKREAARAADHERTA